MIVLFRQVDLGAGTCCFAARLHSRLSLEAPITCVDPSAPMLENARASGISDKEVRTVQVMDGKKLC